MPRAAFENLRAGRISALRSELAVHLRLPDAGIVFEIGCGNGHFLTAYATAHPDEFCVGVDLRRERIAKAARKRDRARLDNLQFFRCEATDFLRELPAGSRLRDIYMLFPDPWPKKRHHKNRLLKAPLLDQLALRAGPGTRLFFRTDFRPYFDEARDTIAGHRMWRLLPAGPFAFEHPTGFQARAPIYHSLAAVLAAPEVSLSGSE